MACALSLWYSGVKDVTIVEAVEQGNGNLASRAMAIHAATLEVRFVNTPGVVLANTTVGSGQCPVRRYFGQSRDQNVRNELLRPLRHHVDGI
jgi:hypothetical protein